MSGPFIFVSTYKVKEGQLEAYKAWTDGLVQYVEANEPRMVAFNLYVNDEETQVAGIQVHPDAESMQRHMDVVRDYIKTAYGEFLEAPSILLACGEGEDVRRMIQQLTPPGFSLVGMPQHIGGFTRSSAGLRRRTFARGGPIHAPGWVDIAALLGTRRRACRAYRAQTKAQGRADHPRGQAGLSRLALRPGPAQGGRCHARLTSIASARFVAISQHAASDRIGHS